MPQRTSSAKLASDGQEAVADAQITIEVPREEATEARLGAARP
jgi:hypothetical protein